MFKRSHETNKMSRDWESLKKLLRALDQKVVYLTDVHRNIKEIEYVCSEAYTVALIYQVYRLYEINNRY